MPEFTKHAPYQSGDQVTAADMDRIEQGVYEARYYTGPLMRDLKTYDGATPAAKLRAAITANVSKTYNEIIRFDPSWVFDAGNTPFDFTECDGFTLMGSDVPQLEFGHSHKFQVRHTGGTAALRLGRRTTLVNLAIHGTTSTNIFVDTPTDASGYVPEYCILDSVSVNGYNKIFSGAMLGLNWFNICSINNASGDAVPFTLTGSDHKLWQDGVFFEMGSPGGATQGTYDKKAALQCMARIAATKTLVGNMYITGSCTTPYAVTGGSGGVEFLAGTVEGRPVPGSGPNFLWCAGELARLSGGCSKWVNKWHGYAMRDPQATGRSPGGFYHISAGDHEIAGGTFQPFVAASYGAYTAGSYNHPAGSIPPIAYVTGGKLYIRAILRGPNCAGVKPVVRTSNMDFVDADTSVEVKLMTAP